MLKRTWALVSDTFRKTNPDGIGASLKIKATRIFRTHSRIAQTGSFYDTLTDIAVGCKGDTFVTLLAKLVSVDFRTSFVI